MLAQVLIIMATIIVTAITTIISAVGGVHIIGVVLGLR